jgi:hypothetical protein
MTKPYALPECSVLKKLLRCDPAAGKLYWRKRPREFFKSNRDWLAWNTLYAGKEALITVSNTGHLRGKLFDRTYWAHRVIWKMATGREATFIDHINGNPVDNRLPNLRDVSHAENMRNRSLRKHNKTGYAGVHYKGNRWHAGIRGGGRQLHLGSFKTREEAIAARKSAEAKYGYMPARPLADPGGER